MTTEAANADIARQKREAAADDLADLAMVAIKAFLTGEAAIVVTDGPHGSMVIAFGSIGSKQEAA